MANKLIYDVKKRQFLKKSVVGVGIGAAVALLARMRYANAFQNLIFSDSSKQTTAHVLPKNYLTGCILSNDTDTEHDINITAGEARDSANGADLILSSEITKQIDATFAAGNDAGGMFTGTVANSTWYHVFLIKKDSDGTIDAGFDTSVTAANIPTGYTEYLRLGSVKTDGSANILQFIQVGKWFEWKAKPIDLNASLGTTPTNYTVSVPLGVNVLARINHLAYQINNRIYIYSPLINDETCHTGSGRATSVSNITDNYDGANQFDVLTNTSSQVRAVAAAASQSLIGMTVGWTEF